MVAEQCQLCRYCILEVIAEQCQLCRYCILEVAAEQCQPCRYFITGGGSGAVSAVQLLDLK